VDTLARDNDSWKLSCVSREFRLRQMITEPTRRAVTKRGDSEKLLDHIYVSNFDHYINSGQFSFAGSDHDLVYVIRKVNKLILPPKKVSYRSYLRVNWKEFSNSVKLIDFSFIMNFTNVESVYSLLRSRIVSVLDEFAPLRNKLIRGKRQPWFNGEIFHLIKERCHVA